MNAFAGILREPIIPLATNANVAGEPVQVRHSPCTEKHRSCPIETVQSEMREAVRSLAKPSEPGESVKACVRRVSLKTGFSFDEIRRLWYGRWRIVPAYVADRIREAKEAHERTLDRNYEALKVRQAALYGLTHEGSDPEFYRARAAVDD